MPAVNPKILVWARETAGLTPQGAVRKIGIKDAYGMAAVDRLAELERGEKEPTRPVLVKMAQYYRRPLLAFYLDDPPPRSDRGADFRMLPTSLSPEDEAIVDTLIRNVQSRQSMVRSLLEEEEEAELRRFVGTLRKRTQVSTTEATESLHQVLGHDLTNRQYYEQPSPRDAFTLLRSRAEASGVFVILKGDLGSHHTAIDVDVFRGFAIADDIAPFVVINDKDSVPAWSFTLLHELVHLLLGRTGISSSAHPEWGVEELCNNAAAEWMLPTRTLNQIEIDRDLTKQQQYISEFARPRNLSHTMVAHRLLRTKRIDQQTFGPLREVFRERWDHERNQQRAKARESESGPNYYTVRRHRVGQALLEFTGRLVQSEALSITKAAMILDVKPGQVSKLLRPM